MSALNSYVQALNLDSDVSEKSKDMLRQLTKRHMDLVSLSASSLKCRELVTVELACRELDESFCRKVAIEKFGLRKRDYEICFKFVCRLLGVKETHGAILDRLTVHFSADNQLRSLVLNLLADQKKLIAGKGFEVATDLNSPKFVLAAFSLVCTQRGLKMDKKSLLEVGGVSETAFRDALQYLQRESSPKIGGGGKENALNVTSSSSSSSSARKQGQSSIGVKRRLHPSVTSKHHNKRLPLHSNSTLTANASAGVGAAARESASTGQARASQLKLQQAPRTSVVSTAPPPALLDPEEASDGTCVDIDTSAPNWVVPVSLAQREVSSAAAAVAARRTHVIQPPAFTDEEKTAIARTKASRAKFDAFRTKVLEKRRMAQQSGTDTAAAASALMSTE
jgi:hypothetical protein